MQKTRDVLDRYDQLEKCFILQDTYDTICTIEYNIIYKKTDLDVLNETMKNAITLIQKMNDMPKCILIKMMQLSQLFLQLNQPILEDSIKEFQNFITQFENEYEQINLIENTENYEIQKAYIFDLKEDFKYIELSPNENYLLLGTSRKVYVYNILTKINIKIFKESTYAGLFSQNSRQIVLATTYSIIIIDINTSRKKLYLNKSLIVRDYCFMNKHYLYLTCLRSKKKNGLRIIKIDLKSMHQISYYINPFNYGVKVYTLEDLIIFQTSSSLQILNEQTRKSELKIKFSDTSIYQFFMINKNELLSNDQESQLIIWDIDYKNNSLVKIKVLPLTALKILRGVPNFGFFYLISKNELSIIDENYKQIYRDNREVNYDLLMDTIQLNSHRIFILDQKDGIYILKRHKYA